MGLAGGIGLFNVSFENAAYALLSAGGLVGTLGHITLMVWGKGAAADKTSCAKESEQHATTPLFKPLLPWKYPLDSAFVAFMSGNALFIAAGILMDNYALSANGLFAVIASLTGWLWPEDKLLAGYHSMQLSALFFMMATISNFIAGFWAMDIMILIASCCFLVSNVTLYTIRKATQSNFTQART